MWKRCKRYGLALAISLPAAATAETGNWTLTVESGPVWLSRNDVQIPNDSEGDRFDLSKLTSQGPDPYLRIHLAYQLAEHHSVSLLYAPLRVYGNGTLTEDVRFAGETFTEGSSVKGVYKFNTYRLGWRYHWPEQGDWKFSAGATLLIRDANVRLGQGTTRADDPDLGVVPLLSLQAHRALTQRLGLELDLEGLGAPQGRAIDASAAVTYKLSTQLEGRLGYRTLEGGADNDSVNAFAWAHYGLLGLRYRF
ncbi:MAG: hypothetical protein HLUCCX14_12075 [Marinobacter excellens HL-55]|uniref:Outer membrane protein beta-barrel domain n=1 Tax=Marinobacter excellens HL-55 TaxID=1305731 RepID=A0A0P7Z0Z8_9GAMM|nr:MAG: hypothetical protein HLUCCX14_12075 [Marinobacter excellens HL-55]